MILLELFWTFFKIGLFTFGGGYAMLPMIQSEVLGKQWINHETLINFVAVSESTPGPFAINMATFVGSTQGGILGSAVATIGVVLPAFCMILLIASIFRNFLQYRAVDAFLSGVRPVVVSLIVTTALTMLAGNLFAFKTFGDAVSVDFVGF